jgi:glycerol-3-phosphate dehydrogenase
LIKALGGRGVYAEAKDGRPVFVLPMAGGVLVGTTDVPYDGDPAEAVATEEELRYLLDLVRQLFPDCGLGRDDIHLHYAGVRPLPHVGQTTPASVTRRHWLETHDDGVLPVYSVIGGKLTTCRSLAEQGVRTLLEEMGRSPTADSRERLLPGGASYPHDADALQSRLDALGKLHGLGPESVRCIWSLFGSRSEAILAELNLQEPDLLDAAPVPRALARWVIQHEWVRRLDDLVERRLMLLFHPHLTRACLRQLAELLSAEGKLPHDSVEDEVRCTISRLGRHFGKRVVE